MKTNKFYTILSFVALVLSSCDSADKGDIIIEIPEKVAKEMGCENMKATLTSHFKPDEKTLTADYKNGAFVFLKARDAAKDELLDISIGSHTLHIAPDSSAENTVIQYVDPYKYIVKEGTKESLFISRYNNYYYDTKRKIDSMQGDTVYVAKAEESYKGYMDSLLKHEPFTQFAYLYMAEKKGQIKEYDFNNSIEDRKLLFRVTQAWEVRNRGSEQHVNLKGMIQPIRSDVRNAVPFSEKATFVNLSLPDKDGKIRSLNELKGKNIVLLFGSARMTPPRVLKAMKEYYEDYKDVEIYHVNFERDEEAFREIASQYPWIMVNDSEFSSGETYQITEMPTIYLFNKRGNFVAKNIDFIGYRF